MQTKPCSNAPSAHETGIAGSDPALWNALSDESTLECRDAVCDSHTSHVFHPCASRYF